MNTNDQPTEPDAEPTVAHYQRSDEREFLAATPAEQAAAVDRLLATRGLLPADKPTADHNRRRAAALLAGASPSERFTAAVLAELEQFMRERRAEIIAAGGDPDEDDRDPLEAVRNIAADYHADAADTLDDYLDRLADELTLDDVRALRVAGEAAVAATPRVIWAEADRGMKAPRIAEEVGLTVSRVYQILRERPAAGDK